MSDRDRTTRFVRRRFLESVGAASAVGIAGCLGGGGDSGDLNVDNSSGGNNSSNSNLPSESEGAEEWGTRINEYANEANIDWQQFEGTELTFGMNVHPFTEVTEPLLPYFEELTGISVNFNTFPEDQLWQKLTLDLNSEDGKYDGFFLGLWPSAQYHNAEWVQNLNEMIGDDSLTDQGWLHMDDYPQGAIDSFTYQGELIAMPFGVEAYGCIAYDRPTFEQLGIEEPTTFQELRDAAKQIHESSEVDRTGICSRASSTTLSSANWATMFRSFGAEWIDRENREATLDSQEGIESLELFAEMMGDYGPADIGTFDWYKANQAFGNGQVGIAYHTPSAVGVFTEEQYERTEWIPPLEGPNGDKIASTWEWALGISRFSENPGAAWLFLQWATSRPAIMLQNTQRWQEQPTYGPARSNWLFEQDEFQQQGMKESWRQAHKEGMAAVPSSPPPVPLETPQNMDIMSNAAIAMNSAVTGTKSAEAALSDAAPEIAELVKEIPDAYIE